VTHTVGIFVFADVEVLDFAGPYEVFTCATRLQARTDTTAAPLFNVFTVGASTAPVRARAGLSVYPDHGFADHPHIDVLIIPGGVVTAELAKPEVLAWITAAAARSTLTASVCTGAFLLAKAGLLDGKPATTHWEDSDDLKSMFPAVQVQTQQRWVEAGDIVTSGGISAGIDMSLHLVERLAGRALATRTARQMEFDWTENR
jgi:transcriptional regulator GlxA family with amidase domain